MSTTQSFSVGKLLLYEDAYAGLITHASQEKCVQYLLMFLGVCMGGFSRPVHVFLLAWLCGAYNKKPLIKQLSFAPDF